MAEAVGYAVARKGFGVVCGGGDGIMEAVCRGCKQGGGTTIGVLKWNHDRDANRFIDYAIPTSMDLARNNLIVWSAIGLVAFEGMYGTASEVALALDVGKPLVVVGEQCLFKDCAFTEDCCTRFSHNDVSRAGEVVEELLRLTRMSDPLKDARNLPDGA